jgi:hypothetical protein
MPPGEWKKSHSREEYVSDTGIIGYRGKSNSDKEWYNHMPAKLIQDKIGMDIWNNYFKFTVVRNPYDKLISAFYFHKKNKKQESNGIKRIISHSRNMLNMAGSIDSNQMELEIESFRSWIKNGGVVLDKNKYLIDGKVCVDYFIRYETLYEDIAYVCNQLSLPYNQTQIPEYKKGVRKHTIPVRDFYDAESEKIVKQQYAWELAYFGYALPKVN